jgi:hypothetical protein
LVSASCAQEVALVELVRLARRDGVEHAPVAQYLHDVEELLEPATYVVHDVLSRAAPNGVGKGVRKIRANPPNGT